MTGTASAPAPRRDHRQHVDDDDGDDQPDKRSRRNAADDRVRQFVEPVPQVRVADRAFTGTVATMELA
jgi:hypothetical protein